MYTNLKYKKEKSTQKNYNKPSLDFFLLYYYSAIMTVLLG